LVVPQKFNFRVTMWTGKSKYEVVKEVGKYDLDFHLTKHGGYSKKSLKAGKSKMRWDLAWWDGPIPIELLQEMKPWQKCNHIPGIYNLARKNMLGRHLMRMQKEFPSEYDFFPETFELPHDFKEFQ